ncbi:unnamed protein product [Linum tenue]|uniref:EF-hand domain-containing protein n=1 Tax=Linum tenue TaxID=586396 RepID=A0AAV0RKT0_9ROSI|nr:unnamed protein product [Linum tenue]CAI0557862.1 unnamed protein product [Linum tenue]
MKSRKVDTFYYVALSGMSVGGELLSIPASVFELDGRVREADGGGGRWMRWAEFLSTLYFDEFLSFYGSIEDGGGEESWASVAVVEKDLEEAFRVFYINDNGFITSKELQKVLSRLVLWIESETTGKAAVGRFRPMIRISTACLTLKSS